MMITAKINLILPLPLYAAKPTMWYLLNRRNIQMRGCMCDGIVPMVSLTEEHDLWTENILHGQFTAQYSFLHEMSTNSPFAWVSRYKLLKHLSIVHQAMGRWIFYKGTFTNYLGDEQYFSRVMQFSTKLGRGGWVMDLLAWNVEMPIHIY